MNWSTYNPHDWFSCLFPGLLTLNGVLPWGVSNLIADVAATPQGVPFAEAHSELLSILLHTSCTPPHWCHLCPLHVIDKLALVRAALSLFFQALSLKLSGLVWFGSAWYCFNLSLVVSHSCTCDTVSTCYHRALLLLTPVLIRKLSKLRRSYFYIIIMGVMILTKGLRVK